ncbi:MAG: hypothetical protein KF754_10225 [Planctomycetes bacterium]|nr:hypothetical protein [Planctomycetota bacterium]
MASRPSGPPKSGIRIDHQAEVDRLARELAGLEPQLKRLSRWSAALLMLGLASSAAVIAVWLVIEHMVIFWGLPAILTGFCGMGVMQLKSHKVREAAKKLQRERNEAMGALRHARSTGGAGGGPEPT